MSIIVKGMDMPKNGCDHCFLRTGNYCSRLADESVIEYAVKEERHPNCPLVEVPTPHGRLIDSSMAYQETLPYAERTRKMILKVINSLPTVIEAEE